MSLTQGLLERKRQIEADISGFDRAKAQGEYMRVLSQLNRACCGILDFRWPEISQPLYFRCGSSDLGNFHQIFINQEYNFPLDFEPARILDLGAYVGYGAIYLATRFRNAEIVSIEPSTANFQLLMLNTGIHSRIRRLNAAVWGHSAILDIASTTGGDWGMRLTTTTGGKPGLRALSVPDIMTEVGWSRIDYLKCDVEGAELDVFRETGDLIAEMVQCCTVEIHESIAAGAGDAVRRAFPEPIFANSKTGEFDLFVRRDTRMTHTPAAVSVLRPDSGVQSITLKNVSEQFWGYYTFDKDSCQIHPAECDQPPAALKTPVDLNGHTKFRTGLSVDNQQGHPVDFIVTVRDGRDQSVVEARTTVAANQSREWVVALGGPLQGTHLVSLRTIMAPGSRTSHQAYANWLSPQFTI